MSDMGWAEIDLKALDINKLTLNEIQDQTILTQTELISDFKIWTDHIKDKTISGQTLDFDINFLYESCKRCGAN
jgi:hypothetical protein